MADELKTVLRLLEAHDIPSIPYKGPMLALTVYGNLALREFGDLDLLLRPADILQAKSILATHGYVPEFHLTPAVEAAFLRSRANYHLVMQLERAQRTVMVELHWKTDPEFQVEPVNDDNWWIELPRIKLDELDVRSFAPHESLLILCLHGSKHFWASLGWLVDVSEMIRQQPALDWTWIIATAEKMRAGRRLAYGLHLLRKLLDTPLPAPVLEWLSGQSEAEALADDSIKPLFEPTAPGSGPLQLLRMNFRMYETWPQRLRHASDVIFSPSLNEWSRWPLPRPLFFLYPPLRLFRLLSKHASALIQPNATLRS
jgi:hypothetical protein